MGGGGGDIIGHVRFFDALPKDGGVYYFLHQPHNVFDRKVLKGNGQRRFWGRGCIGHPYTSDCIETIEMKDYTN